MTNFEKIKEFHKAFKRFSGVTPELPNKKLIKLRIKIMKEEMKELIEAIKENNLPNIAKELSDVLVVVYGTADSYGINADKAFDLVHKANMSKLDINGQPIMRDDGKILKGPNYQEPNMKSFIKNEIDL